MRTRRQFVAIALTLTPVFLCSIALTLQASNNKSDSSRHFGGQRICAGLLVRVQD
jgi:hypothetical protein